MKVLRLAIVTLFLGLLMPGAYAAQPGHEGDSYSHLSKSSPLQWIIDIHDDKDGYPRGNLMLFVQGHRVMIARGIDEHIKVVDPSEYADRKFPKGALLACAGWWAGGGDDFYVVRRGHRLRVYRRYVDEMDNGHQRFRLVKTIRLSA